MKPVRLLLNAALFILASGPALSAVSSMQDGVSNKHGYVVLAQTSGDQAQPSNNDYWVSAPPKDGQGRSTPSEPRPTQRNDQGQPQKIITPNPSAGEAPTRWGDRTPSTAGSAHEADVVHRLLQRKLGPEVLQRFDNMLGGIQNGPGLGSPSADTLFDQARSRFGAEPVSPAGTRFFQQPIHQSTSTVVNGSGGPVNPNSAQQTISHYRSIPGGVVLEGKASGLDWVTRVRYESRLNAFVLGDRAVYFSPIPRDSSAILAAALAKDDRVGVSLGQTEIVYGDIPEKSEVAMDLKMADSFLGSIVFARGDVMDGYRFANGYRPNRDSSGGDVAVFFKFKDFQFSVSDEELHLTSTNFEARIVPLLKDRAADGGGLPDLNAIAQGKGYPEYESNAKHVGENINYYRRERIVDRTFAYGEVAAFLRALKENGIDLQSLARNIENGAPVSGISTSASFHEAWLEYLKGIQAQNQYQNWVTAPYDLAVSHRAQRTQNNFIFADSDRRYLTSADLQKLSPVELRVARNEIFARRGRYFKDNALRAYFSQFPWYHPYTWDVALNSIEQTNVGIIQSRESGGFTGSIEAPAAQNYIFGDSQSRYLSRNDLQGLSSAQLRIARNEIFARKGRYFKDDSLRAYFSRFAWYRPYTWDVQLNPVEAANVKLIGSMER